MSEQEFDMPSAEASDTQETSVQPVGAILRAAREARGIQVHEIAATLKLGLRQVTALENGEWQALPGHTFIRGFVRNYARLVELDPAPLMTQLDSVLEKPVSRLDVVESGSAIMPQSGGGISRRDRNVVLGGLLAVLLAAVVYVALPDDLSDLHGSVQSMIDGISRKDEPAPAPADAAPEPVFPPGTTPQQVINPQAEPPMAPPAPIETPAPASAPAAQPAAQQAEASAVVAAPLRLVVDKESWVEIRDRDNKVVFSQKAQPGSEHLVSGSGPFSLVVGYAPGVKLFLRGQPIDLAPHTRADVARLVLE